MPWDAEVSVGLKMNIEKWVRDINRVKREIPRSVPLAQGPITAIDLYVFADAIVVASCDTVYAVVHQSNSVNQRLVTSKLQISKHNITISRLELISTHMRPN